MSRWMLSAEPQNANPVTSIDAPATMPMVCSVRLGRPVSRCGGSGGGDGSAAAGAGSGAGGNSSADGGSGAGVVLVETAGGSCGPAGAPAGVVAVGADAGVVAPGVDAVGAVGAAG